VPTTTKPKTRKSTVAPGTTVHRHRSHVHHGHGEKHHHKSLA
jgi:hypothetical protein